MRFISKNYFLRLLSKKSFFKIFDHSLGNVNLTLPFNVRSGFFEVLFFRSFLFRNRLYFNTKRKIFISSLFARRLNAAAINEVIHLNGEDGTLNISATITRSRKLNLKTYIAFFDNKFKRKRMIEIVTNGTINNIRVSKADKGFTFILEISGHGYITMLQAYFKLVAKSFIPSIPPNIAKDLYVPLSKVNAQEHKVMRASKNNFANFKQNHSLLKFVSNIPHTPTDSPTKRSELIPLSIGMICDPFMSNVFEGCFSKVEYLNNDNYISLDEENDFDAIFYTTPWGGIDGEWRNSTEIGHPAFEKLNNLITYFQAKGKPFIFLSKEDPSNFHKFLPIAQMSDYVFTIDELSIENYQSAGITDASLFRWAINPEIVNPLNSNQEKLNAFLFAGSSIKRYAQRQAEMSYIFDKIIKSNADLFIVNRNSSLSDAKYNFPQKFKHYIYPSLSRDELFSLHKKMRFNINLNSIKSSPTMLALRNIEFSAMGLNFVSNYSKAMLNQLPHVPIINKDDIFSNDLSELEIPYYKRVEMAEETIETNNAFNVAKEILNACGFKLSEINKPNLYIITKSNSQVESKKFKNGLENPFFNLSVIDENNLSKIKPESFYTFEEDLDDLIPNLRTCRNALRYSSPDCMHINSGEMDNSKDYTIYSSSFLPKNSLISGSIDPYKVINNQNGIGEISCIQLPNNDISRRNHFSSSITKPTENKSPLLSIIIPVFNNGINLIDVCIKSLSFDKWFTQYEIIIVNDGSDCQKTIDILKFIESTTQHKVIHLDKPSGSASLPRNKGIDLAASENIAFLDPDNSISINGYSKCLELISKFDNVKSVFGTTIKISSEPEKITTYYPECNERIISDTGETLRYKNLGETPLTKPLHIFGYQAAVFKKEFLIENNLRFKEGTIGQDSLFCWEVLATKGEKIFIDEVSIKYFSERLGSVTNSGNKNFSKRLLLENYISEFIKNNDLLPYYLENKLPDFINTSYKQLISINKDELESNISLLSNELSALYDYELDKEILRDEQAVEEEPAVNSQ